MEKLAEEATRDLGAATSPEDLDQKVEQALACPCLDELKEGPCGSSFIAAFSCFLKSRATEKGSDCVAPFKAMQQCMIEHPQAFAEYVQAKDADTEQKASAIGVLRTEQ
ncbi:Oxidoreductase [Trebouxia sp. C0010 RCD-2024]